MEPLSRRVLLTSGMAGLVAATLPDVQGQAKQKDEVGDHILREAQRLARDLRNGTRRHETITALAVNFRLHAAHVRSTGVDAVLARAVTRRVARSGRDTLIEEAKGPQAMQRHHDQLRAFGLEDLHVPEREITRAQTERVLTSLTTPGTLAATLEQAAGVFDHIAERMAASGEPHIVRVQDIAGWCNTMTVMCQAMREATAIICTLTAAGFPELAPLCAIFTVEAATACFLAWWGGC
jgi:hypothetical protein